MFNPDPQVRAVAITPRHACYVVDDALSDPAAWVDHAVRHREEFADIAGNAFPGPELPLPAQAVQKIGDFFAYHARSKLGGRRTLRCAARLSLTTRRPEELRPPQWICHIDRLDLEPGQLVAAAVLYLFDDPSLGGTAFYMPTRPMAEVAALIRASASMPAERFSAEYGIAPGYMTASNAWFRKVASIPARRNRMIFYSGTVLHSGEILHPERLVDDPRHGRLTINAFFTCTRRAAS